VNITIGIRAPSLAGQIAQEGNEDVDLRFIRKAEIWAQWWGNNDFKEYF
jgi:hypothetical protein